jgi:peptide/nickel transport system substrate-binding protein
MRRVRVIVCALVTSLAVAASVSARAENVVRWGTSSEAGSWDVAIDDMPVQRTRAQVYEGLTLVDSRLQLQPGLATSWTLVGPDTWRFVLRQGVRFHDGTPLTAEDVVFSVERRKDEGSETAAGFAPVAGVRALNERTIEITTKAPTPGLPVLLWNVSIMSKAWADQHGAQRPARRGDVGAYTTAHANGTGPFMLESVDPDSNRTVLVRNPSWWGLQQYPHNIDRIVWTVERDPERRLALLLKGDVDLVDDVPPDRVDRLQGAAGIRLATAHGLPGWFLTINQGSPELRSSDVKGRNPFADRRVREAIYRAIDAGTLIGKTLGGLGDPAGMIAAPGENGYDPELDRRLPYDPERAKALLAEAGYPDGFAVRLDCVVGRADYDELAAQLARVGIRATMDAEPFEEYQSRVAGGRTDGYVDYDIANFTFDSAELLHDIYHSPPTAFWLGITGYANPTMDALLDRIDVELSSPIRDALLEQAWRIGLNDIVVVPLYRPFVVWAVRDGLDVPVSPLNIPLFRDARVTSPR